MKNYKIAVAGTGYVGLSLGVLFAQHHQVVAVDIVQAKVDMINNKKSPIQDDYIEKYLAEKDLDLTATLDAKAASINDLEKSRDYRCRPYEYQIENGFMVTSENYVLGYKASLIQGVTPGQIRERMEKLNPDRFRVRKFGVSDVIVTSIGGKMQSYYVNPKELIC